MLGRASLKAKSCVNSGETFCTRNMLPIVMKTLKIGVSFAAFMIKLSQTMIENSLNGKCPILFCYTSAISIVSKAGQEWTKTLAKIQ